MLRKTIVLFLLLVLVFAGIASADVVSQDRARNAAENWLTHVVRDYGSWGGASLPSITGEETFVHNGVVVGYNFTVNPKGHILVSARDDIPAVKLFSETSTLSMENKELQEQIEWIAEEVYEVGEAIDAHPVEMAAADLSQNPDRMLWSLLDKGAQEFATAVGETATEAVSYGPLLTTTWAQGDPYNQQCPLASSGCRTIVGCVATAASQIMKYWNYPRVGQGSTSYTWNNVTLSRNFANSSYDWVNMPNAATGASSATQKSAVAKLSADVGIAFHMGYGCGSSGAQTSDAPNVFKNYFKYQSTASWVNRSSYASASAWMKVFKAEVQAGRPSQLRINDPDAGGHSVVIDGYRDSPSETVHINMGWSGSYNGWYVPDSYTTGSYHWTSTSYQGAAIGIQPPKRAEIIGTWSDGIWNWDPGKLGFTKMYGYVPSAIAAGDFNGDGRADVASCWGSGLWYQNGATLGWTKVYGSAPSKIAAGRIINTIPRDMIICVFSSGIWYKDVTSTGWAQMYNYVPTGPIAAGDFDGDGRADVASSWGAGGLWYQNAATLGWTKIFATGPTLMTAGNVTGN